MKNSIKSMILKFLFAGFVILTSMIAGCGSGKSSYVPADSSDQETATDIPSVPQRVAVSEKKGMALVSWALSENADSYRVYYSTDNYVGKTDSFITVGNTASALMENPTPGETYAFAVSAINEKGESGLSEQVSLTLSADTSNEEQEEERTLLLEDDFEDGIISNVLWAWYGNTVVESMGIIDVQTTVTDKGGSLYTAKPMSVDPNKKLIIERDVRLHYGNDYYDARMCVYIGDFPVWGVSYTNYQYSSAIDRPMYGFYLFRNSGNTHTESGQVDNSPKIEPIWDVFFTEKIVYRPATGNVEYYIDGSKKTEFFIGRLTEETEQDDYPLQLCFGSWGWWTGHSNAMSHIRIYQE